MSEHSLRPWRRADLPGLAGLWRSAFGDDDDYISTFRSLFLKRGGCVVAEAGGRPVSAMYVLDGPTLCLGGAGTLSAAYTCALATDPLWRNRGVGTAVYKACVQTALTRADAACVLPASPELYPFYEQAGECAPLGSVREARLQRSDLAGTPHDPLMLLLPEEYERRRENILQARPHAVMPEEFYVLQSYHMARFGGGFFASGSALAAVELADGLCRVIELLDPVGDGSAPLAAVAGSFDAPAYLVRTPLFLRGPGSARPFMLASLRPGLSACLPHDLWWGFAFD